MLARLCSAIPVDATHHSLPLSTHHPSSPPSPLSPPDLPPTVLSSLYMIEGEEPPRAVTTVDLRPPLRVRVELQGSGRRGQAVLRVFVAKEPTHSAVMVLSGRPNHW